MSRKRSDDEPIFKGYDEEGEPIFVWSPEIPEWMRREYVAQWKALNPRHAPEDT